MLKGTKTGAKTRSESVSPLTICRGCGRKVPRTNLCLYCGAPILFRKPAKA